MLVWVWRSIRAHDDISKYSVIVFYRLIDIIAVVKHQHPFNRL